MRLFERCGAGAEGELADTLPAFPSRACQKLNETALACRNPRAKSADLKNDVFQCLVLRFVGVSRNLGAGRDKQVLELRLEARAVPAWRIVPVEVRHVGFRDCRNRVATATCNLSAVI
jgi:hypothetical protein